MPDAIDSGHEMGDDVTALREQIEQLRAQLVQARQGTHNFVAMLAHELRTPLGAILMWAHVLRMGRPADREAAIDAIEISAHEQSLLIGSLLDLTRALAGRLKLDLTSVDLQATVLLVVDDLKSVVAAADTRLNVTHQAGTFLVHGDAGRLRAMISFLLKQAIRVTPAGGTVDVTVTQRAGLVCLTVADAGPGLTARDIDEIFTPFVPTGDREHGGPGGIGLELPLVDQLARLHQGTVSAENRTDGPGSVLVLKIPVDGVSETAAGRGPRR